VSIRYGYEILEKEIESEAGEIGQIKQSDGTFVTPEHGVVEPFASIEEKILAENQYQTALLEMQMLGGTL